jgi:nicotinamidase-related amidase
MSESKLRVLIVVDVQQCFIEGTLGGWAEHIEGLAEFKRRIIAYVDANKDTRNKYDVIVFTKDSHPASHSSFLPGPFPAHCHDCDKKIICFREGIVRDEKNMSDCTDKDHAKEDIDYSTPEGQIEWQRRIAAKEQYSSAAGNELIINFEGIIYNEKIMLKNYVDPKFSVTELKYLAIKPTDINNKLVNYFGAPNAPYVIRLNKGELCNFDANGAFYYHIEYAVTPGVNKLAPKDILTDSSNPIVITNLSTGLGESLKKLMESYKKSGMVIDVCGLVTNICVVKTCITGVEMFKALSVPNVTFKILNQFCYNLNIPTDPETGVPNAYDQLEKYREEVSFTNIEDAHGFHPQSHTTDKELRRPNPEPREFTPVKYTAAGGYRNNRRRISRVNKGITKRKLTTIHKSRNQQQQRQKQQKRQQHQNRKRSTRK